MNTPIPENCYYNLLEKELKNKYKNNQNRNKKISIFDDKNLTSNGSNLDIIQSIKYFFKNSSIFIV